MSRLQTRFAELKEQNRAALVTFVTAGDPDYDTSLAILKGLPKAGADVIELGMPFTDPMADGPAIQLANLRALGNGQNLAKTLQMVREFVSQGRQLPLPPSRGEWHEPFVDRWKLKLELFDLYGALPADDPGAFEYHHRRRPLYPLELEAEY